MKTTRLALFILSAFCSSVPLFGAVVLNQNIALADAINPPEPADYTLSIYQDEAATDSTAIWFDASATQLTFVATLIDDGSDWYLVQENDVFTTATIEADTFPILVDSDSTLQNNVVNIGSGVFYLGVTTGKFVPAFEGDPFVTVRDVYGWVKLDNNNGTLSMLENAVTYSGDGIIVGTTTVVPEPTSTLFLCAGLLWVLFRKRAK